ncbi:MAG: DUF2206 domain-containing protein [Candidatus Methanoperedens sp.]|nr:DUF2206 domain-containing protein [Candidatus Methanoperedens sp.]
MLGAIGLDFMGIEIPILRQVVGFIYLTFVPGIIILRILKLHKLGVAVTVLLSAGLSISFLMFSGFFLNSMLSFLNINSPLSFWNVVIFVTVLVAILCILSCRIDRYYQCELIPLNIPRSALYLMLLPVLSIVGTYFVNFHNNNILLLILIVVIALIPVLVAFKKIPSELYPLTVVVIAVSLLLHYSLISMYLTGYDIYTEYYFYKLVVNNAYWNSNIYGNANAMLSITILPAIYSYFLKIDGAWVFKIVYPIIFSLVPLGLYCVYQRQIKNDKIAFYSVFFFMSFFVFFTEMLSLARQQIAELFFVLLILLTVQDTLNKNIRNILLLVFGASLVVSHYGLSYIYIFFIILISLFSISLIGNSKIRGSALPEFNLKKLTLNYFMVFYIVFLLLWYINVSRSSAFTSIVNIGDHLYTSIFTDFFNPATRDRNLQMALGIADPVIPSIERQVHRSLQFITQLFIILGFFKLIIDRKFTKLKAEYFYLIVASLAILFLSLLPNFANKLNMTRIYHIALLAISPLFVMGGIFITEKLIKIIKIENKSKKNYVFSILISGVIIPYLLFNTGFVYEITNDKSISIPLGMERMKNDNITKFDLYRAYTPEHDVYSAKWYYKYKDADEIIYADKNSAAHVLRSYGMISQNKINRLFLIGDRQERGLPENHYVYMNKLNVCEDTFVLRDGLHVNASMVSLSDKLFNVYSNGCGDIYKK